MKRPVALKALEMKDDEYSLYQKIVASYTTNTNKGEELFYDLFETDGDGNIVFLKPPSKKQTSMEVFLFLMSLMEQQHIRLMYRHVEDICKQVKDKFELK